MYSRLSLLLMIVLFLPSVLAQDDILPYQDADLPIEERVTDLLDRMTLEEKIGQMTLIEKGSIEPDAVNEYFIGAVLSGGGGYPTGNNTPQGWLDMVHAYQDAALTTRLGIPILYGVDAIHGHNNLTRTVIFPHNVGLGAARNPDIVQEIGRITAKEMIATGIYWNYAPILAVPQDIRWGRTYEGYSENTELVTELSTAMLIGMQGDDLADPLTVLGTPKHFVGDGGTAFGTSPLGGAFLDRGVTDIDEETLREIHLAPYYSAIDNGARSIMISYSSWGGERMHGQEYLIQDVLLDEMGFEGFIVSDWEAINDVAPQYYNAVVASINAGIDMNMVPYDYVEFTSTMNEAVDNGDITMERLDEAVGNILRVKFELGLFENPYGDASLHEDVGSAEHRAVAREAVSQSLVLLKNENNALPIDPDAEQTIYIAGEAADNVGIQNGGWTIEWQGLAANLTGGTTIRQALQREFSDDVTVRYNRFGQFTDENDNPVRGDLGIVVVGELPYAEWFGDNASLMLPSRDRKLIADMREQVDTLVVILLSGRPLVIDESLNLADAFVAAWLPGTEGDGVSDVLLGDRDFVGTLPYTWLRSVEQLPFDFDNLPQDTCDAPLFPFGYGLTYESNEASEPWLVLSVDCAPTPVVIEIREVVIPEAEPLAPEGEHGVNYVAPYPVSITLDGDFADWAGVPVMSVPQNPSDTEPAIEFGAVADDEFFYFYANVTDDNIISGEHGENYWNEDSLEFYINATGDLELSSYRDGVAQITVPALNITNPEPPVISGVNGATAGADLVAIQTPEGWAIEASVPLTNDVWSIVPASDTVLGFQVHLNSASTGSRDAKLIWSNADTSDISYQRPNVFGQLSFHEIGTSMSEDAPIETDEDTASADDTEEVNNGTASADETEEVNEETATLDAAEWELIWSDEFDGDEIDSTMWTYDTGGDGFGNNELQYYTNRPENSFVADGNLHIVAQEERFISKDYTSAKLWTLGSMAIQYGRIDVRAKLPYGHGIWPAVWMLPTQYRYGGWPASGEIDIMELVGHEPDTVHGTLHYTGAEVGSHVYTGDSYVLDDGIFADNFHVFSIVWEEDRFEWYVDGELYQTQTEWQSASFDYPAPFDQEFFLILNLAVGGDWPGSPYETTEFPQQMLVDYVRVYQLMESNN